MLDPQGCVQGLYEHSLMCPHDKADVSSTLSLQPSRDAPLLAQLRILFLDPLWVGLAPFLGAAPCLGRGPQVHPWTGPFSAYGHLALPACPPYCPDVGQGQSRLLCSY